MTFTTNDFRGEAHDPINVTNMGGTELYEEIKEFICVWFAENNIPAKLSEEMLKSGSFFGGSKVPILLINHPDPSCKYFTIGVYVNGSVLNFKYLGKSEEQYKYNLKEARQQQGNFLQTLFIKPNEFKIQQEFQWQAQVLSFIEGFFS